MITMFNSIVNFFRVDHIDQSNNQPRLTRRQQYVEDYLSESVDLHDLERRERELERKGLLR